jgi:hypothetical protein
MGRRTRAGRAARGTGRGSRRRCVAAASSWPGLDHFADSSLAQFAPQPGIQRLQRVTGLARRIVGPNLPGQHDTPGVEGEQSEQNPQLTAADETGRPVSSRTHTHTHAHLKRPIDFHSALGGGGSRLSCRFLA